MFSKGTASRAPECGERRVGTGLNAAPLLDTTPSASEGIDDVGTAIKGAAFGRDLWLLPAVERFGEGILLMFKLAQTMNWPAPAETIVRAGALKAGIDQCACLRQAREFRRNRHEMRRCAHPVWTVTRTLSHASMTQVAFGHRRWRAWSFVPLCQTQGMLGGLVELMFRFERMPA